MHTRIVNLIAALSLLTGAQASANIRWLEKNHDFGLMLEQDGPKTGTSRFVNLGPDTISIFSVKPSCGCTSADYDESPLAPGDTAVISYTYDPYKRPGKFEKSVKVRLSDGNKHSIMITGNVLGTSQSVEQLFPFNAGKLRISKQTVDAGEVIMGRSPLQFVNAYSMPLDTIHPVLRPESDALIVTPKNPATGPGEVVAFSLNFDSYRNGSYGPVEIPVHLFDDTADGQETIITFRAFVIPDSMKLLAVQKEKNPQCRLQQSVMEIGNDARSVEITLTNIGNGPLHLLRVAPMSDAIKAKKLPKEIKPGKSAGIKFDIDRSKLASDVFRIPVEIVTDDPDHPRATLYLTSQP